MSSKLVAIVGAGPCGLVALKEMREAGIQAFIIEASGVVGGVFAHPLPCFNLTISNYFMAFSDFPPKSDLEYSTMAAYLKYVQDYAAHFQLHSKIEFHTSLESAELNYADKWVLTLEKTCINTGTKTTETRIVDALIVASGCHREPRLPDLGTFSGDIIHSSIYTPEKKATLRGKKCLLIGSGESAADICADVASVADELTIYVRKYPMIAPRVIEQREDEQLVTKNIPLSHHIEFQTTSRITNEISLTAFALSRLALLKYILFAPSWSKWSQSICEKVPLRADQSGFVTKNSRMSDTIDDGKATLKVSPSAKFVDKSVIFADGTKKDIDAVVLCTGYHQGFPFLKVEHSANPRTWWRHCFHPKHGDKLFFIGYARPHQGGIPACAEILSRYIALILSGKRSLPPNYAELAVQEGQNEINYFLNDKGTPSLVDYFSFMESIARQVGCKPQLPFAINFSFYGFFLSVIAFFLTGEVKLIGLALVLLVAVFTLHNNFFLKYIYYPQWPAWYRLNGHGKKPEITHEVLRRFPISAMGFHPAVILHILLLFIQRVVDVVLIIPGVLLSTVKGNRVTKEGGLWMFDRPKKTLLYDTGSRLSRMFAF